jgi:hypothetical protein
MMKTKTIVAGTIALSLAGAGLALAQSRPDADRDGRQSQRTERGFRPSAEDIAAYTDARIAALKAGLRLSAEQEKHWPAVETALRDLAKQRAARRSEFADRMRQRREAREAGTDPARPDLYDRLRNAADRMTARANAMKQLADAVGPLYQSLDDGQKRRLATLTRMGRRHGFHARGRWRGDDRSRASWDDGAGRGRGRWSDEADNGRGRWNDDSRRDRGNDDSGSGPGRRRGDEL